MLWVGATQLIDRDGDLLELHRPKLGDLRALAMWNFEAEFYQPGCLFSRHACEQVGGLDERLHFALDPDLWMRLRALANSRRATSPSLAPGFTRRRSLNATPPSCRWN